MPDKAHEQTDKELKRLEKQITKEYSQAAKEVEKKLTNYLEKFAKKDAEMQKKVASGQMSAEEYGKWRIGQMAMGERWKEMQKTLTEDLVNADKIAAGMINDSLPSVYANNFNYGTYEVEHGARINTSFTLYDHATVENLMKKDPKIIPQARVDIPKDELWNRRKLTSAVTQGILQGEDIRKISGRLREAVGGSFYTEKDIKNAYKKTAEQISKELERRNRNAAIRNARTYTTAAENKGRIDSYDRAEQMGIKVKKKWMATLDDRTRVEHRHLDGQVRDNDEPFETDGYEIMYPGDPSADPEMIYNCRCTLVAEIEGYQYQDERNDSKLGNMTYEEWKHAKDKPGTEVKEEEYPWGTKAAEQVAQEEAPKQEKTEEWMRPVEFTPAQSIEEAEQYAKENFVKSGLGFTYTGQKISYKGIDLDVANRINQRLTEIFENFNIPGLESIESFGKGNKKVFKGHEDAAMLTSNFNNLGLNKEIVGSLKSIAKYNDEGEKSFQFVMDNIDALTGAKRELAEIYKEAGRQLVGNDLEDFVTHEIGHHIAYSVGRSDLMEIGRSTDWKEYAIHISGYANQSFDEYIAESFNSYYRGETENLQPEMVEVFERLRKK